MYFLLDILKNEIINVDNNDTIENEILDKIYYLHFRPLTKQEIINNDDKKNNTKIKEYLKTHTVDDVISECKNEISRIEIKSPLYDIYTENIYLVSKHNVYSRVMHQHYRFPENILFEKIKMKKKEYDKMYDNKQDKLLTNLNEIDSSLLLRKIKKINLMIDFLGYFNLNILYDTYIKIFYKYSPLVGKNITICKNPSFLPQFHHIKPYLSRSEVINSALNFGITIPKDYIEQDEVNVLCKKIFNYQIDSNVLLEHQHHILNSGSLGLVQYYTLQGSYFMNQYMRNLTIYDWKNYYIEELIKPMWNLVITAPPFDKSYIFYRFIGRDDYLKNIKVGDIYTEQGFMSATRDPFYRADLYKFGFILIKIKVPAGKVGVALCLETISHFPEEQEIIFSPNSKFKLISRDLDAVYYHTDINFSSKVKTRYEFEYIESENVEFFREKESNEKTHTINFLNTNKIGSLTLNEKIKFFDSNFVNKLGQFIVNLGKNKKEIVVLTEWFDSTGAYKKFYAIETNSGYSMYSIYKGYILFFIELGETNEGKQMHVNYYVKYSSVDTSKVIGDENLIDFFSSIANYFDISNVVLYANYLNCSTTLIQAGGGLIQRGFESINKKGFELIDGTKQFSLIGGSYCNDLYQYLNTGIKKYSEINILNVELRPKFSYHDLNYLKTVSPINILAKDDIDELYQLYNKHYKFLKKENSIAHFYLWLIEENKCYLLDLLIQKIDRIMGNNNPFKNDVYILDASTYLYNRKYIKSYPINISITPIIKRNIVKPELFDKGRDVLTLNNRM